MTIASQTTAETMLGDGENREFPFTFQAWEGEIRVVLTDPQNLNLDVTGLADIQIAKDSPGGVVTYPAADGAAPLPSGWKLTVLRNMNFLQAVRLVNATRYDPVVVEQALDRLTAACQQLREMADRAAHIPVGSNMTADEFLSVIYDARAECLAAMQEVAQVVDRVGGELDAKLAETAAALEAEFADCLARVEPLVERVEETAAGAESSAVLARKWAVFPEDTPVASADPDNPHSPALFSAFHWAQKAQAATGVHDASQTQKGIAFAATAAEVAAGETDPARGGVPAFITPEALGAFSSGASGGSGGVPSGVICMWSGAVDAVPDAWALCDGTNGTPDLRDRFVVGAGGGYAVGVMGGSSTSGATTLATSQIPGHTHSLGTFCWTGNNNSLWHSNGGYTASCGYETGNNGVRNAQSAGGGGSHTHTVTPPYYALAYIMKL